MGEVAEPLLSEVRNALVGRCGVPSGAHLVVGVSGGCDSVALLSLLSELAPELELQLTVAHLDHGLRAESAADAEFVRMLCCGLQIPCVVQRSDVGAGVAAGGGSIEMVARDARHAFFKQVVSHQDACGVVLAHTADDQAETLLLNLCRGSGLHGLTGMRPRREVDELVLLRPLLGARRSDLEAYLMDLGTTWREDPSNTDRKHLRNRVRHDVVPALSNVNGAVVAHLAALAEQVAVDDACLDDYATEALVRLCRGDASLLVGEPFHEMPLSIQRRVVRLWAQRVGAGGLSAEMTARLLLICGDGDGAKRLSLGGGVVVESAYGVLRCVEEECGLRPVPLSIPGEVVLPMVGLRLTAAVGSGVARERYQEIGQVPSRASVRLGRSGEWVVRSWEPGDRMRPLGLGGSRKLQDIFCDGKVPRAHRNRIPIVVCGDEVVWIPGYRVAAGWEVADPAADSVQLQLIREE